MDSQNKLQKNKSTKKYISTKVPITKPFFELQTPEMTKYKSTKSTKVQKYKSTKIQKYKNTKTQKMQKM